MKKITFILFALIAGTTFAQDNANATATVNAEIVETIGITSDGTALNFGKFTTSTSSATVKLLADGTGREFSATDMEIASQSEFSVPTFTVTRDTRANYGIALAVTTNPTMGEGETANSMTLSNLTSTLEDGNNSTNEFSVGGVLTVPADGKAGIYTGLVTVTVTYE